MVDKSNAYISKFDIRLGLPSTKLALEFDPLSRKWNINEPYKQGIQELMANSLKNSENSPLNTLAADHMILSVEDEMKIKVMRE